jgi:hypothetical protein
MTNRPLPEYASIWRHSSAARSEVSSIALRLSRAGDNGGSSSSARLALPRIIGQQVVEVVGDAAGQHAQAFQFLGLLHLALQLQALFLGPLALGDIGDRQ